ncbi:hypothetical protein CcCBS67573_g08079 [Chytriomyces confervae]|uniref:Methyltransferase domain-containing protein n=1 Tax=Chytriomyces confervae TaxID=246404 RepID=A0A507ENF8_9FUNG|nr:hypothetical protein CcCBS67573_g08079 [Chytriomyces confervae]
MLRTCTTLLLNTLTLIPYPSALGGSLHLYLNSSGSATSLADHVRALHKEGHVEEILDIFAAVPRPPQTTLCCVNPTPALLIHVKNGLVLQGGETVLSIGSGSGLFEYLLQSKLPNGKLVGVDVAPINLFLAPSSFECIHPDEQVSARLGSENVVALLSVYLRRPQLLQDYLHQFPKVSRIVLIGPRNEDPLLHKDVANFVAARGFTRTSVLVDMPLILAHWDMLQVLEKVE